MRVRSISAVGAVALSLVLLNWNGPLVAVRTVPEVQVALETTLGTIETAIDVERAPATAANFLRYVDARQYDGGRFHRAVRPGTDPDPAIPIELVQASRAPNTPGFAAIPVEGSASALRHTDGVLAMAQSGSGTVTSDFFICLGDQPALDEGGARTKKGERFPVFGRVVAGMDIVRAIQAAPVIPGSEVLAPPIVITKALRVR